MTWCDVVVVDDVAVAVMWSSLLPGVVIVIVVEVAWPKRAVTKAFNDASGGEEEGGGGKEVEL